MSEPHSEQSNRSAFESRVWLFLSVISALWLLCALVAFSNVGVDLLLFLVMFFWGSILAAVWMLSMLCLIWIRLRDPNPLGRLSKRTAMIILATPICGVLGAWLLWTDLDLILRLKLSERALITHCESVIADPERAKQPRRWFGLLRVYAVDVVDADAVRVTTVLPGIFDEAGVYYDPDMVVAETNTGSEQRSTLFGPWKRFVFRD